MSQSNLILEAPFSRNVYDVNDYSSKEIVVQNQAPCLPELMIKGGSTKKQHKKHRKTMKLRTKLVRKHPSKKHKWSIKYKRSINCRRPKGFSQKQYCKYGRK